MGVFKKSEKSHLNKTMFFDEPVDIARYDRVKYPQFEKFNDKMLSLFWRPEEVNLDKDKMDFRDLTAHERHIFTSNLKRQILLDSVQGRGPVAAFGPIVSLPELETCFVTWEFFETIHSRSYTHIIRNVYSDPSKVFDSMLDIPEIVECANDISQYYDELIHKDKAARPHGHTQQDHIFDKKKALWLCLNSVNALEGIRFYVSFACSWAFAELKKMEGNAKLIKLIARDENIHLAISTALLKQLPKDDPDFGIIAEKCKEEVQKIYVDAVEQEKKWAEYLFSDGSMIGLNAAILQNYAEWIGTKRMRAVGVDSPYSVGKANPLPWTEDWISGGAVQVAPQQTQIEEYLSGGGILHDNFSEMLSSLKL